MRSEKGIHRTGPMPGNEMAYRAALPVAIAAAFTNSLDSGSISKAASDVLGGSRLLGCGEVDRPLWVSSGHYSVDREVRFTPKADVPSGGLFLLGWPPPLEPSVEL